MDSLPQDVVMASGLYAFKRGLVIFLEEKSITGYKPCWECIISRFKRKVPQNARCRGGGSGDRSLYLSWVLPETSGGATVRYQKLD